MRWLAVVLVAPWLVVACGDDESGSEPTDGVPASSRDGGVRVDAGATATAGTRSGAFGGSSAGKGGSGGAASGGGTGASAGSGSAGSAGGGATSGGGAASMGGGTASAGGATRACLPAGAYCTWSTADECCSGSCDGDSCCGFLGDACTNGFGCCAGDCIDGYCQCPPGTRDCGSGCVDIEWNETSCGGCDIQCGVNSLCESGSCVCDPNLFDAQFYVQCPDGCFNTRQDGQHCGDCTTACAGGTECAGGTCQCPFATLDCGTGCTDITADPLHCGSCSNVCDAATEDCVNRQCQCKPGLFACTPGVCVDRQTDESNCGTCGMTCIGNKTCQGGKCLN